MTGNYSKARPKGRFALVEIGENFLGRREGRGIISGSGIEEYEHMQQLMMGALP